jgi:hypothetical protein
MDLRSLSTIAPSNEGANMVLRHPVDGTPLLRDDKEPMYIRLAGMDSEHWRRANQANFDKRAKSRQRVTAAIVEEDTINLFVACTLGWNIQMDGKDVDFTEGHVRGFYTEFTWAREQADNFVADRANFLRTSSKS